MDYININVQCLVAVKVEPTVNSSYEWKYLLIVLRNSFPAAPYQRLAHFSHQSNIQMGP